MSAASPVPWTETGAETGAEKGPRTLFTHSPLGVAKCSRQGTITEMNPALEQILGGGKRYPLLGEFLAGEHRSETEQLFREMEEGKRDSFQIEHPVSGANPDTLWVKWTVWRVDGQGGELDFAFLVAEDTSAIHCFDGRLQQAGKLETVGRMAGGIAHDFNNLLTGVLLYCDLLLGEMDAGTRLHTYVEQIRSAGLQASGVVAQLLATVRPQEAASVPLSLNQVIEGMRELLLRLIGENNSLDLRLAGDLGLVKTQPAQAQQILLNLILNARDAMPAGGQITVETGNCEVQVVPESGLNEPARDRVDRADGTAAFFHCALLVVSDNGTGMSAATRERVFEPFFTTKDPDQGTGLGLATVHEIVTGSGGLIHLDSAPGRGTRVTILLPLLPQGAAPSCCQGSEPENTEGEFPKQEKEITP
jgi:two-component system, cell cycle sensor histidine kinase and response regulator CckA